MENQTQGAAGGEGAKPQDPQAQPAAPQDPGQGEGAKPQDPQTGEGAQVNPHKLEADLRNRDKKIAELEAELKAARGEAGSAAEALKQVEALKAELADEKLGAKLSAAGCVNNKAAKALLDDYDGDVDKLKEACPYLFGATETKTVSTGGTPAGNPNGRREAARRAAGLPIKE